MYTLSYEPHHEKICSGFLSRSDTKQVLQPQKPAGGLNLVLRRGYTPLFSRLQYRRSKTTFYMDSKVYMRTETFRHATSVCI